jgi:group I intron endonuclease
MKSGIYKLTIKRPGNTELFYYGQSVSLYFREAEHKSKLRRGVHNNPWMLRSFNKYGNCTIEVVCYAPPECLDWLEQAFLDRFVDHKDCLNILRSATHGMRGRTHSEETRRKISASHRSSPTCITHIQTITDKQRKAAPKHLWEHPTYGRLYCAQWELRDRFPDVKQYGTSSVVRGNSKSHKGWRLV